MSLQQAGSHDGPDVVPTALGERKGDENAEGRLPQNPEAEARTQEFERTIRAEQKAQFQRLKYESQAIYGLSRGVPGVRSPEKWAEIVEKAGDEIGNGRFIVRCLGAERYLDYDTVAVLVTLRQNLISDLEKATAVDIMMIDAAIIAYYNMLRVQGWIGNLSIVVERELFGQEPLNKYHGHVVGDQLEKQLGRLAEVMLPLQDRASRMMMRSLESLAPRASTRGKRRSKRLRTS